ncbi:MAG: glycosyltransferase family 2 protein [Flavobacteriales bacterium]|nr:glycosyltransferase family 2 protein [Flavobacteriales bacterium]
MAQKAVLSIGIPTFNRFDGLMRILDNVTNQSYRDLEIIVSDDSTDPTVPPLDEEYVKNDGRIRYFKQPENKGAAHNYAFVLEQATSEYFMWLADDDELGDKDYLLKLMNEIAKGYDFVFPNVRKINMLGGKTLENNSVKFTSESEKWFKHLEVIRKMYIGYQIESGVYKRELIQKNAASFLNSYYYEGRIDGESTIHFMLSRYNWSYVEDTYHIKDMTGSNMHTLTFWGILIPNFWNFVAAAGVIAQANYKNSKKVWLIFWKMLRNIYIQLRMIIK